MTLILDYEDCEVEYIILYHDIHIIIKVIRFIEPEYELHSLIQTDHSISRRLVGLYLYFTYTLLYLL